MKTATYLKVSGGLRAIFLCDYCGKLTTDRASHYKKKKHHCCDMKCYALDRMLTHEQAFENPDKAAYWAVEQAEAVIKALEKRNK